MVQLGTNPTRIGPKMRTKCNTDFLVCQSVFSQKFRYIGNLYLIEGTNASVGMTTHARRALCPEF